MMVLINSTAVSPFKLIVVPAPRFFVSYYFRFAFPEKGGAFFSSAVKCLTKKSLNLFRLSTVASRLYANVCPLYLMVVRG